MRWRAAIALLLLTGVAVNGQLADDIIELEHPAFNYRAPARRNAVSRLNDTSARPVLAPAPGAGLLSRAARAWGRRNGSGC